MNTESTQSSPSGLENIKHIVVLMFENRSFDHIFGAFPGANGLFETSDGNSTLNPEYYNLEDPLSPPSGSNPKYFPATVNSTKPLAHDFTHDFGDGMMPDLFGPVFTINGDPALPTNNVAVYTSGYAYNSPVGLSVSQTTYPATNSGFYTTYNSCSQQQQSVLSYFAEGELQVLNNLAGQFVLCDNWYCDMPGHTLPNRAFIHCAQTGATGIDDTDGGMVHSPTIFDLINSQSGITNPPTWKMYAPVNNEGNPYHLDTKFLNCGIKSYPGVPLSEFTEDCNNGTLPFYSFIMCFTPGTDTYTDTSMHPASMIQPGENFLAGIYNTLSGSKSWNDTLLVVTFDENGGIYDHVFPPNTTAPFPYTAPTTQCVRGCCGNNWILNSTFDFTLLGLRVPAMLISPWLGTGIDSTQYQNTSVTRFIIDRMNAIYGTNAGYLTSRDENAPLLDSAFSQFGQSVMRTDTSAVAPYTELPCVNPNTGSKAIPHSDGKLTTWIPPAGTDAAPPVGYINELLNIYVSLLPGHPDSGKTISKNFTTIAEVDQYIKEREQAASKISKCGNDNGNVQR